MKRLALIFSLLLSSLLFAQSTAQIHFDAFTFSCASDFQINENDDHSLLTLSKSVNYRGTVWNWTVRIYQSFDVGDRTLDSLYNESREEASNGLQIDGCRTYVEYGDFWGQKAVLDKMICDEWGGEGYVQYLCIVNGKVINIVVGASNMDVNFVPNHLLSEAFFKQQISDLVVE